jgi:hypothetical protein
VITTFILFLALTKPHPSLPPEVDPCAWNTWSNQSEVIRANEWAVGAKSRWLQCRGDLVHKALEWATLTGQDPFAWFPINGYDLPDVVISHIYKINDIGGRPDYAQGDDWEPWVTYDSLGERRAYVDPFATNEIWFNAPAIAPKVPVVIRWVRIP